MGNRFYFLLVLFACLKTSAGGAATRDDQSHLTAQESAVANPAPTARDFVALQSRHKLLVGVIDSGVDYNHPDLLPNLHFELDPASGQPTRLGWDWIGGDPWPAPYLARTTSPEKPLDPKLGAITRLIEREPALGFFLDPKRNVTDEISGDAFHGTHVTHILAGNLPEIGILPYRVIPCHLRGDCGRSEVFIQNVLASAEHALGQGARILNLSINAVIDPEDGLKFQEWLNNHPDILVVAAAGNNGALISAGQNLTQFPCGARAANLLCVGALDKRGGKTDWSSKITNSAWPTLWARGVGVRAASPSQMCWSPINLTAALTETLNHLFEFGELPPDAASILLRTCKKYENHATLTGTSMATPQITRQAALLWLKNPELSPTQVIRGLIRQQKQRYTESL